jgi:hypothetical protein
MDNLTHELDGFLDAISYELTNARTLGLHRPEDLRASLRRARELIGHADALASAAAATQREPNPE